MLWNTTKKSKVSYLGHQRKWFWLSSHLSTDKYFFIFFIDILILM